jgi:class 3 adenylate cyclase
MAIKNRKKVPKGQALFRKSLKNARGRAEQVIVLFVDVRGFSAFSSSRDSVDIGLYIRRFFISMIEEYFPRATFHKSTGDGMMIVYPYQERNLNKIAGEVIDASLRLNFEFSKLAERDQMITFESPKSCGIGINRGTVCCIESGGETLDYSGHVLNLAARLMDMARPEGIVLHGSLGNLIPIEYSDAFELSSVYVRGIAENQPMPVYSLKGITSIPQAAKSPPQQTWGVYSKSWKAVDFRQLGKYTIDTPNSVSKPDDLVVRLYTPGRLKGLRSIIDVTDFNVRKVADKTEVVVDLKKLGPHVKDLADEIDVLLELRYRQA